MIKNRVIGLDILRSIAIIWVVYMHAASILPTKFWDLYHRINFIKIDGVALFFVLSGFLIGRILIKTFIETTFNIKDLFNFWVRRWFRTIPNYLLILILILVYNFYEYNSLGDFSLKYLFFIQNFISPHPNFFPEAWSLAVEEWFYLLLPFVFYLSSKILNFETLNKRKLYFLILIILIILIPFIIRCYNYEHQFNLRNDIDNNFRKIMTYRLDAIVYGVLGAYISIYFSVFWFKVRYISLSLGLFFLLYLFINKTMIWYFWYLPLDFSLESLVVLFLLPYFSNLKQTRFIYFDKCVNFISVISYSMYLLNLTPILIILLPRFQKILSYMFENKSVTYYVSSYFFYWFFVVVFSYLLYHLFEKRVTKLRDKFFVSSKV
jgi:peptidoglycan/LPS O-acetylase OafA/YrhL